MGRSRPQAHARGPDPQVGHGQYGDDTHDDQDDDQLDDSDASSPLSLAALEVRSHDLPGAIKH